jgi:large subunit ribosomal protein L6
MVDSMTDKKIEKQKKVIPQNIIDIADDITLKIFDSSIEFEKAGTKQVVVFNPVYINAFYKNNKLYIVAKNKKKTYSSVSNTTKKLVLNALEGFDKDFVYTLEVVFSHFPINVKVNGNDIIVSNFLGERKPRKTRVMPGCKVVIKEKNITVSGKDKYLVGQTAANLEKIAKVTKKDYRVFDDGIYITGKNI